jgi:transcriptional regulator with GAF, ATPase, and Fis domain
MQLIALANGQALPLDGLKALTAVGGARGTGVRIPGLNQDDDYCVVAAAGGRAVVHLLKGKKRGQAQLSPGESCALDDLTLLCLPGAAAPEASDPFASGFDELLRKFSEEGPLEPALHAFLDRLLRATEMEKGIVLTRSGAGYRAVSSVGLDEGEPWLSEALVRDALDSQRPVWLQNRIGSAFEASKSLIAAGFLSVFALPLIARGETLGAVVLGSNRPHGGLSEERRERAEAFSRLGALLFWFQQQEEALRQQLQRLRGASIADCPILTASPRLQAEIAIAQRVAATRLSVLISGETGAGKELMAQWIHAQSERRAALFVALNCGAIPGELLESILFGHRKGAFTGAVSDQAGKFQLASGGTLFLDEIGDLPERLQVKLLRVLQEGAVEPLGAGKPVKVDVRVVAATHRNLSRLVAEGRFRQDLYYRIAETVVTIPALRERPEDVALLAAKFLKEAAPEKTLPRATLEWLSSLAWPGNVRELRSAVQRAAALAPGRELREADFLVGLPKDSVVRDTNWLEGADLEEAKQLFVQRKIRLALDRSGGNRQKAADLLGVTARTLFRYLEDERERQPSQEH